MNAKYNLLKIHFIVHSQAAGEKIIVVDDVLSHPNDLTRVFTLDATNQAAGDFRTAGATGVVGAVNGIETVAACMYNFDVDIVVLDYEK